LFYYKLITNEKCRKFRYEILKQYLSLIRRCLELFVSSLTAAYSPRSVALTGFFYRLVCMTFELKFQRWRVTPPPVERR